MHATLLPQYRSKPCGSYPPHRPTGGTRHPNNKTPARKGAEPNRRIAYNPPEITPIGTLYRNCTILYLYIGKFPEKVNTSGKNISTGAAGAKSKRSRAGPETPSGTFSFKKPSFRNVSSTACKTPRQHHTHHRGAILIGFNTWNCRLRQNFLPLHNCAAAADVPSAHEHRPHF